MAVRQNPRGAAVRSNNSRGTQSALKESVIQLVGFTIGPKLFGADILSVREILRHPQVAALEAGPEFIAGAIRVRGGTIPVIDLSERIGGNAQASGRNMKWALVAQAQDCPVGFIVDAVTRILKIDTEMILPAPDLILCGLRNQYIRGVCDTEKGLLMVLELSRLLMDEEVKEIRRLKI
jgi:purine-binding chemotaxis protein CheW